jgi:hypothetical protein
MKHVFRQLIPRTINPKAHMAVTFSSEKNLQSRSHNHFNSFNGSRAPWGPRPSHFSRLHDHTLFRHTTLFRTPLDEGPARRSDLYLTTHNTHKRQTSMP